MGKTMYIDGQIAAIIGAHKIIVNRGRQDSVRDMRAAQGQGRYGTNAQIVIKREDQITVKDPESGEVLGTYGGSYEPTAFFMAQLEDRFSVFDGDAQRDPETVAQYDWRVGSEVTIAMWGRD